MEEHFLEGRGIAYQTNRFERSRPTLILIHGFSSSLSIWAPFIPLLGMYNLVTYDLRGNGKSVRTKTSQDMSLHAHVADLHALISELKIEQPVIVGYSYGAIIAMEYARAFPKNLKKIIFLSPVYGMKWRFFVYATWRLIIFFANHGPSVAGTNERVNYAQFISRTSDRTLGMTWQQLRATGSRSYFWQLQQMYAGASDKHWRDLSLPCLIIHGSEDSIIPLRYAILLQNQLKDVKLIVIERGNHMLPIHHAPDVVEAIRNDIENY
jgi:non-heme chloroperoxidase